MLYETFGIAVKDGEDEEILFGPYYVTAKDAESAKLKTILINAGPLKTANSSKTKILIRAFT